MLESIKALLTSFAIPSGYQAIIGLVVALVTAFFGSKLLKPLMGFYGACLGLNIGMSLSAKIINTPLFDWLIGIAGAVVLGWLLYRFSLLGLILFLGIAALVTIAYFLNSNFWLVLLSVLIIAICIILVWKVRQQAIIICSSLLAAADISLILLDLLKIKQPYQLWIWLISFCVMGLAAMMVQFITNKKKIS